MKYSDLYLENTVLYELKKTCEKEGLRVFCRKYDLDPGNVSNIINGKRVVTMTIGRIFGYEPVFMWRKVSGSKFENSMKSNT